MPAQAFHTYLRVGAIDRVPNGNPSMDVEAATGWKVGGVLFGVWPKQTSLRRSPSFSASWQK
jgi:hypothetical protein